MGKNYFELASVEMGQFVLNPTRCHWDVCNYE